jgi:biotin carboxylase
MNTPVLLIVHRGSPSTPRQVQALRDRGYEPLVLTSAPADDGAAFRAACAELGVDCVVMDALVLELEPVLAALGATWPRFHFCLAVWDGHRALMAAINQRLGAADVAPGVVRQVQDKYSLRRWLAERGLSRVEAFALDDERLRARLAQGERFMVKPRRGLGSLSMRAVTSIAAMEALDQAFRLGCAPEDLFADFFVDNALYAESFVEGVELSIDFVRQGGRSVLTVEHEKTVLDFTGTTVLERGLASPPVTLSERQVHGAIAHAERLLALLQLSEGCYHVDLRLAPWGEWELIEINTRMGGGLIQESIRQQHDRLLLHDWAELLDGKALPQGPLARRCGTYFQISYPHSGRTIARLEKNEELPAPAMFVAAATTPAARPHFQVAKIGAASRGDREDIGAMVLWRTELATHRAAVERFAQQEYTIFHYAS